MPLPGSTASAEMKAPKAQEDCGPCPRLRFLGAHTLWPCRVLRPSLCAARGSLGSEGDLPSAELQEPLTSPRLLRKAQMQVFSLHSRSVSMRKSRMR